MAAAAYKDHDCFKNRSVKRFPCKCRHAAAVPKLCYAYH